MCNCGPNEVGIQGMIAHQLTEHHWDLAEKPETWLSQEQLQRMYTRYAWAASYCHGRDVLEVACGVGQGLGMLASVARSVAAGDGSRRLVEAASATYGSAIEISQFDAESLPYDDGSFDVLLIAEAIYYLPNIDRFLPEARRVLRAGGTLLIATANKDLYDFHRSPHSFTYLGVIELEQRLGALGFSVALFGDTPTSSISVRQKLFRPLKALAARLGLIPKTLQGRTWIKRVVFGQMLQMPASLNWDTGRYIAPTPLDTTLPDRQHKVLLCAATVPS